MDIDPMWIAVGVLVLIVVGLVVAQINSDKDFDDGIKTICEMGFDGKDVRVFLESYDYTPQQFIDSKGIRSQYQSWSIGENMLSGRISVISKQKSESAQASSNAALAISVSSMATMAGK